ncbi:MAG: four helix bundle protein [Gemmatimonadaceae bacterium]
MERERVGPFADQLKFMDAGDPLRRMAAYRLSLDLVDVAWPDAQAIRRHSTTKPIASQLYRAAGSIGANISEGYSRSSGRDRVRLFEYALGSARECRHWYYAARHVLAPEVCGARSTILSRICQLLLVAIPEERHRAIRSAPKASGEP